MAEPLDYRNLDINQKINLKGLIVAWSDIAIERFQGELDKKVYSPQGRRSAGRSRRQPRQTGRLRADWQRRVYGDRSGGVSGLKISFLLYGRFVDLGVGKGIDFAQARYSRSRRNGDPIARRPKRWYSKRKGFETHRLRELLSRHYVNITLDSLEAVLEQSVTVHV